MAWSIREVYCRWFVLPSLIVIFFLSMLSLFLFMYHTRHLLLWSQSLWLCLRKSLCLNGNIFIFISVVKEIAAAQSEKRERERELCWCKEACSRLGTRKSMLINRTFMKSACPAGLNCEFKNLAECVWVGWLGCDPGGQCNLWRC